MTAKAILAGPEALTALENLAAKAERELLICLPELAPTTPLLTERLTSLGLDTWADLLALLSRRGLDLRILIADTDPLLAPDRHRAVWTRATGFADVLQGEAQLICAAHGQIAGGLRAWPLRRRLRAAMAALRAMDAAQLTPVQRALLATGVAPRPADIRQSFAIADGHRALIGGADLGRDTHAATALTIEDKDFCGALRAHFADTWAQACASNAPSLAASLAAHATPIACPTRPQSRDDLRLLRTLSQPQGGATPRPMVDDIEVALIRLLSSAQDRVMIRTAAFCHDALAQALVQAAASPALKVALHLPTDTTGTWDDAHAAAVGAASLRQLQTAFGPRLTLSADPEAAQSATVCLIDDVTLLGSATLTRRACRWNSEAMGLVRDAALTQSLLPLFNTPDLATLDVPDTPVARTLWPADLF